MAGPVEFIVIRSWNSDQFVIEIHSNLRSEFMVMRICDSS